MIYTRLNVYQNSDRGNDSAVCVCVRACWCAVMETARLSLLRVCFSTWNSLHLCWMFIFSINPCSSIIKSSIKTAPNYCPAGELAFKQTHTYIYVHTHTLCWFMWMIHFTHPQHYFSTFILLAFPFSSCCVFVILSLLIIFSHRHVLQLREGKI